MYVVRHRHVPAPGKGQELRAALEEHTKASNASGGRYGVQQQLYCEEPVFFNSARYESLEALESYTSSFTSDPERMARLNKIGGLLARPQTQQLWEILLPGAQGDGFSYILRTTFYPTAGKQGEVFQALEKRASAKINGTVGTGIWTQVATGDGPNFTLTTAFANLAGLEEFRTANRTGQADRDFGAVLGACTSRPSSSELLRLLN